MFEIVFPENKMLYFPAFFVLMFFIIAALFTVKWFKKISKKEEQRGLEIEARMKEKEKIEKVNKEE